MHLGGGIHATECNSSYLWNTCLMSLHFFCLHVSNFSQNIVHMDNKHPFLRSAVYAKIVHITLSDFMACWNSLFKKLTHKVHRYYQMNSASFVPITFCRCKVLFQVRIYTFSINQHITGIHCKLLSGKNSNWK